MGTLKEKFEYVEETKQKIREALEEMGATVTDEDTFRSYAEKIAEVHPDGLYIEKGATGKQIHTYVDSEIGGIITDYNGVTAEYHEKSYIHLDNSDYSLGMKQDFIEFVERIKTIIIA